MYNKAILIGRLTADPEMRVTQSGVNVASCRIAVDRRYFDRDGERVTDFLNIVCWRNSAEFVCRYFSKGQKIGVEGEIQTRSYTDKDGIKRFAVDIAASRLFFVESKGETGNASAYREEKTVDQSEDYTVSDDDGDLPF